jgi:beta-1,4-mannooligosaccharide/beta-1,4-mannosyl-N-acetylglucosamine phosphorylase
MRFATLPALTRHVKNPLIQAGMSPYPSTLTFNAGVAKYQGRYVMAFRNDYGFTQEEMIRFRDGKGSYPGVKTNLGLAFSQNGIDWEISPKPFTPVFPNKEWKRAYDPRLTVIEGRCHICFAVDTPHGIRGGIAVTEDFEKFKLVSMSVPDNRNMVLFPEKIGGRYMRLERPFPVYGNGGEEKFDIWISESPDLEFWGNHNLLLATEQVPFCNGKLGPAAPPVKTKAGWLTTFHAVWKHNNRQLPSWPGRWDKEYIAGVMLLDLENPAKILGLCEQPLFAAEAYYELEGYRGSVVFPGGMILEDDGQVKIYYGAADTVECLATAHTDDLIEACLRRQNLKLMP